MPHDDAPLAHVHPHPHPIQQSEPPARHPVESTNGFRPPGYDELPGTSNASGFFAAALQNQNQNINLNQPHLQQRFPSELNVIAPLLCLDLKRIYYSVTIASPADFQH